MELPWDFVVSGVPVSSQSKNGTAKRQYRERVAEAARSTLPDNFKILTQPLQIHITYFFDGDPGIDVDNPMKLIQDALTGVVYADDSQLVDRHGHLRDMNAPFSRQFVTPAQLLGFSFGRPFVHVRLELPGDMEELP